MFILKKEYLPSYTYLDYEQWEGKWELIDGIPYAMAPAPGWYHQKINGRLFAALDEALKICNQCEANMPINWKIGDMTIVEPDVVVVCKPFEEGLYLTKTPEIIFEILSPSTAEKDRTLKYELYRGKGVGYYIIVHPIEKIAEVFLLDAGGQYIPQGKYFDTPFHFEISGCSFDLDFGLIW